MQIVVLPTETSNQILLALIQLYLYDLSEHELADIGPHGQFADSALQTLLAEPNSKPFLMYNASNLLGFACVGCKSERPTNAHAPIDIFTITAFFILRRYRRQGLGRIAAHQLFQHFPGQWEIATSGANTQAIAFWRSVIDSYTNGLYNETWLQHAHWRGSVQIFLVPASSEA